MPIAQALHRLATSTFGMLQTRAELALVEVEEEAVRYFTYLLLALVAVFCLFMAFLLTIVLIVAIYWDTYRIESLLGMILFFLLVCGGLGWKVRASYKKKPRLLDHTLAELHRDADVISGRLRRT
jgi:uncharacterized membrane protein YqjE